MEHPQRNRHPGPPLRLLTGLALVLAITACASSANLPVSAGFGPDSRLPPPQESLIPTVKVAKAVGWPYSYFGQHTDRRVEPQDPQLVAEALVPDYALGAHTASLGLAAAEGNTLPRRFRNGMFVGQHSSWNRKPRSGYKVIFVPLEDGEPAAMPLDVLTGFLSEDGEARGRPVGVAVDADGALLVADDVGNVIWRVSKTPD